MGSTTLSSARPKRARNARTDGDQGGLARPATTNGTPMISPEQRHAMIAETAYQRAERREFAAGDPIADWLESEKEVDALLSQSAD